MRIVKHSGQRAYTPNKKHESSFPKFLQRLSSASNLTVVDAASVPVTRRKPKHYQPLTTLALLEWEFMCWRPSLDDHDLLITRNGVVSRDLSFVEAYDHAYL